MLITKPMLAETLEVDNEAQLDALPYPVWGSPKLDGIRCLKGNDVALSRKFKAIPNLYVQYRMQEVVNDLDGELMVKGNFNSVQSAIMSEDGEPDFQYYVFDYIKHDLKRPYTERMKDLMDLFDPLGVDGYKLPDFCIPVLPVQLNSKEELLAYEQKCLDEGYEGIMIRTGKSPYKCGRSTLREGYLLKVKRFKDSEARIIGFEEQMENTNEATVDELGHTKRSSHKSGMVGKDTLGKFIVVEVGNTPWRGKQFAIGTGEGLTESLRKHIWMERHAYLGKLVTYKYQVHGIKDLPRLPIWKGFRDERDL